MIEENYPMRINKYLALRGFATRKGADTLIEQGKVFINGKRAALGQKIIEADLVEVRSPAPTHYRYFAYHKPKGVITHSPQHGEKDIAQQSQLEGVFPVGRLDKASRGLIILTDDARITDRLLHPKYVHDKEYIVTVRQKLPQNIKEKMEKGVNIEGYTTKPSKVRVMGERTFAITITEGKKHQIRRMCAALRLDVSDLLRTRIMNIKLGNLAEGEHRAIRGDERERFFESLNLSYSFRSR